MQSFYPGRVHFLLILFTLLCTVTPQSDDDASVMQALKKSINPPSSLDWSDPNPCNWAKVHCSNNRVDKIQIGSLGLTGTLPPNLNKLTALTQLELMNNSVSGPLPTLSGLKFMQILLLHNNHFTVIPDDFFDGMTSLQNVDISYNSFSSWQVPDSISSSSTLQNFSAISTNLSGEIPQVFSTFPGMTKLALSFNMLTGGLPEGYAGSSIQILWLNGQKSGTKLTGPIDVLQNMTQLTQVWLHSNSITGPIPDLSQLKGLKELSLRDNMLTGPVPDSLVNLPSLEIMNLTNNLLQGPTPRFKPSVAVDLVASTNSFCLDDVGVACDPQVNILLSVAESFGYPNVFAQKWKGNSPCTWPGITCVPNNGNITIINFPRMGLMGTISPAFASFTSLQKLILANNNITGVIPNELTNLANLVQLDVSNNLLHGKIPPFRSNVLVNTDGNADIGKDTGPGSPPPGRPGGPSGAPGSGDKKSSTGVVVGSVVGGVCAAFVAGLLVFFLCRTKRKRSGRVQSPNTLVIHPRHSGSDQDAVKITVTGTNVNGGASSESLSLSSSGPRDMHIVEAGNMVISIQVLRNVTNNFSNENILGRGGFGTVYKGELHDGTKIAVKRMESGVMSEKGLDEFKSEIAVLTKVRHRHLVALLGYCLDGNERLLVYEYMPQGTLSRYLFNWKEEGLKPLEWMKRLTIALDVARGVEYLHGLAQQSFIHRDLKPSNILLGDDMRAKVADFGLVRLAPDGKASLVTRLAGTFGYLAPEYAGISFSYIHAFISLG